MMRASASPQVHCEKRKLKREYIVPNAVEVSQDLHFDKTAYNAQLPLIEAIINGGKNTTFMECMPPTKLPIAC
jgi:hypothetical protein